MSNEHQRCFKHYCRTCHAMHFVRIVGNGDGAADYPKCCDRIMAYLGIADAVPGRDESLKTITAKP